MSMTEGVLNQFAPLYDSAAVDTQSLTSTAGSTSALTEGAYLISSDVGFYVNQAAAANTATSSNSFYLPAGVYPLDVRAGFTFINFLRYDTDGTLWILGPRS